MRKSLIIAVVLTAAFLARPFSANACEIKPYVKNYLSRIQGALGGEKPKIILLSGKDSHRYAFYRPSTKTIHIYKGDYKGRCANELPFLKSVLAHEYAHYLSKPLKKITGLNEEKTARIAEHAIADTLLGGAKYDNSFDLKYPAQYLKLKNMIKNTQIAAGKNSAIGTFSKAVR